MKGAKYNMKKFEDLMIEKGYNGNQLSIASGVAVMSINDLKTGKAEFKNTKVENALKIAKAFEMSVEDIYKYLYIY